MSASARRYGELFLVFSRISSVTFGGGLAMLSWVEKEVVTRRRWLSREEFLDLFGISQSMPGVMIMNMATAVGYKVAGKRGALVAQLATALPPFAAMLAVALFFRQFKDHPQVAAFFCGMRPAVIALITLPVIGLYKTARISGITVLVPLAVTVLIVAGHLPPSWIILGGLAVCAVLAGWRRG